MRVAVTGSTGLIGQAVITQLLDHGYEVRSIDRIFPESRRTPFRLADMTRFGEVVEVLHGVDAVIHLAAIPSAGTYPDAALLSANVASHYHVLKAAQIVGIRKVVTASSIQVLTQIGADEPISPSYFPVDETHPLIPANSYGLSKVMGETADQFFARTCGIQVVSLRFCWVTDVDRIRQMPRERGLRVDLWSYVDVRDAATACRLAIEADGLGWEAFFITASDTVRDEPTVELLQREYPGVPIKDGLSGHQSCFDISKARKLLGYEPQHSWRDRSIETP